MKRLFLLFIFLLSLSFMLIACGEKKSSSSNSTSGEENTPLNDGGNTPSEEQKNCEEDPWSCIGRIGSPTIFTVTGFDTLSDGLVSAYINANKCTDIMEGGSKAVMKDCSKPTEYANLVNEYSKVAVWLNDSADALYVSVRIQMDDNGGNSKVSLSPADQYQYSEYKTAFPISSATEDKGAGEIKLALDSVEIDTWNKDKMDKSSGAVTGTKDNYPNNPVALTWNYKENKFSIDMTLKGKQAPIVVSVNAKTRIQAENGVQSSTPLENKMFIP